MTAPLTERDRHLIEYIKAGAPVARIKSGCGGHEVKIRQRIDALCLSEGLTYTPTAGGRGNFIPKFTARDSGDTYRFRVNLYNAVTSYAVHWPVKLTNTELARMLGVSRGDVIRIMQRPHEHDWSLVHLSRFARALGTSFNELVSDMTQRGVTFLPKYAVGVPVHPSQLELIPPLSRRPRSPSWREAPATKALIEAVDAFKAAHP